MITENNVKALIMVYCKQRVANFLYAPNNVKLVNDKRLYRYIHSLNVEKFDGRMFDIVSNSRSYLELMEKLDDKL